MKRPRVQPSFKAFFASSTCSAVGTRFFANHGYIIPRKSERESGTEVRLPTRRLLFISTYGAGIEN